MRVLVVGAGPAGSAAAITLARAGAAVTIFEKQRWPRPKTCGDGVSPEGVAVCDALGIDLRDRTALRYGVMSAPSLAVFKGGWSDDRPWGAIVERDDFDDRLVRAAIAAGAAFEPQTPVQEVEMNGRGARVRTARDLIGADAVLIADGATGALAATAGFRRHRSRLVAIRGYVTSHKPLDPSFGLHFDRTVNPGYAWIFPLDERRANVGICVDDRYARRHGNDLRAILNAWLHESPVAREAFGAPPVVERLTGGVIPTGRPRRTAGALFAIGDAAGTADPFSAEGIAPAMQSGIDAARALIDTGGNIERATRLYRGALRRVDASARASRRMRLVFPAVVDPLAKRAAVSPALAQHLSSEGFFRKSSVASFLWGIARTW